MKASRMILGAVAAAAALSAQAASYNITTTFYEPDTQPKDSIFVGSFDYDSATHTVSGLTGKLSESMTGTDASNMTWLDLSYQLVSWYDASLGGTFAAVFKNSDTKTFFNDGSDASLAGNYWSPEVGALFGGTYYGFPKATKNPGNAYALIFVPNDPLSALTPSQIDKLAYADCAPGGMMGAVCMTGTTVAGYGVLGTMSGYPVSQTITAAVPEPSTYALLLTGLAVGAVYRRRTKA